MVIHSLASSVALRDLYAHYGLSVDVFGDEAVGPITVRPRSLGISSPSASGTVFGTAGERVGPGKGAQSRHVLKMDAAQERCFFRTEQSLDYATMILDHLLHSRQTATEGLSVRQATSLLLTLAPLDHLSKAFTRTFGERTMEEMVEWYEFLLEARAGYEYGYAEEEEDEGFSARLSRYSNL